MGDSSGAIPDGIMAVVGSEIWGLGARVSDLGDVYHQHYERPSAWYQRLLSTVDTLAYDANNLRAILLAIAKAEGYPREQLARWASVPVHEQEAVTDSHWAAGAAAAALGNDCPAEALDAQESYRSQAVTVADPETQKNAVTALTQLLALLYTWDYEAEKCDWLSERTKKCIKNGWYLNPKAAPSQNKAEEEGAPAPQLEAVPASA